MGEVAQNKTIEEWRSVLGFGEGYYEVSSWGRYRSLDRIISNAWGNGPRLIKGRVMKLHKRKKYWYATLTVNGVQKNVYISRLVARAFPEICGEWFDECQVDHINGNRDLNVAWNLRVCTAKENMNNPITVSREREAAKNYLKTHPHPFLGRHHSPEAKKKMSEVKKKYTEEELKEHKRNYNEKHKEKLTEYYKEYYQKNKEKKRLQAKLRYHSTRLSTAN